MVFHIWTGTGCYCDKLKVQLCNLNYSFAVLRIKLLCKSSLFKNNDKYKRQIDYFALAVR